MRVLLSIDWAGELLQLCELTKAGRKDVLSVVRCEKSESRVVLSGGCHDVVRL